MHHGQEGVVLFLLSEPHNVILISGQLPTTASDVSTDLR